MKKIQGKDLISNHTVAIFDSSYSVADSVQSFSPRKLALYTRQVDKIKTLEGLNVYEYVSAATAGLTNADICMLDGNSIKALAVRYPSDGKHVLVRLALRKGWLFGLPGLLRRQFLGRIKLGGVVTLVDKKGKKTHWLVINKTKKTAPASRLLLPKSVGSVAFFDWLRNGKINYVVPRFFAQLPELHREGGDLDLLVADDDVEKVVSYIRSLSTELPDTNDDSIPIGMHSVSLTSGVPYYPPPLARQILERAIDGPAGSRVPMPEDALHAFIYHTLYHHKGYSTNIPSTSGGKPEHPPENDYGGIIKAQAKKLGISVGSTMEEMDEYMESIGWRPKKDTLAKIAEKNMWVRDRFFNQRSHAMTGLSVFLLKEKAVEMGLVDKIIDCLRDDGLVIVESIKFNQEQKKSASDNIRGGNWAGLGSPIDSLLPSVMVISIDPQCAHLSPVYAGEYERFWSKKHKTKLRKQFDQEGTASFVHAADNTEEAWEYIEACFSENDLQKIKSKIEASLDFSVFIKIKRLLSPDFISHKLKYSLREFVMKRMV